MDIIPGRNCAEALLALNLPVTEVVRVLMKELDLTAGEAAAAVAAIQYRQAQYDESVSVG